MTVYTKGQRVNTNLGPGVIIGFERFDANGMTAPLSDVDVEGSRSRVEVELDDPSRWAFPKEKYGNPYIYRDEMSPE